MTWNLEQNNCGGPCLATFRILVSSFADMGKEGERLKSHARASAHHAAGAVDGESPTPKQASQPQPQTTTMTDAKMLQLISMLEKACNLRDRSLGTPVAARDLSVVGDALSAITGYACGRVLAECEQQADVVGGRGPTSESYTSSDGQQHHGGQTHTRHTALARKVEHLACHATRAAEACHATRADEAWQGPPGKRRRCAEAYPRGAAAGEGPKSELTPGSGSLEHDPCAT